MIQNFKSEKQRWLEFARQYLRKKGEKSLCRYAEGSSESLAKDWWTEEITKAPGKEEVEQFLELTRDQEYLAFPLARVRKTFHQDFKRRPQKSTAPVIGTE